MSAGCSGDTPNSLKEAYTYLHASDAVMRDLVDNFGIQEINPTYSVTPRSLTHTVISQQLSNAAASAIQNRFDETFQGDAAITVKHLERLRGIGISEAKSRTIITIYRAVANGDLCLDSLSSARDEEVRHCLTQIKGVGPWTADMTLIFSLGREDIFSSNDGALRSAINQLYGSDDYDSLSSNWAPYRSFACLLLWKFIDNKVLSSRKSK